jgi:hypothetical protein
MNDSNDTPPCVKIAHIDSNLDMTEATVRSMLSIFVCRTLQLSKRNHGLEVQYI